MSSQVLELDTIPKVVTLIGGGYIGMEFAGMFARLGCEVHVVARQELPLAPRFDGEVRGPVAGILQHIPLMTSYIGFMLLSTVILTAFQLVLACLALLGCDKVHIVPGQQLLPAQGLMLMLRKPFWACPP